MGLASLTAIECIICPIYWESYKSFVIIPTQGAWNLSFLLFFFLVVMSISTFCYNRSLFKTSKNWLSKMCVKGKIEIILRTRLLRWLWGTARINLSSVIIWERGAGYTAKVHSTFEYVVMKTHLHCCLWLYEIHMYMKSHKSIDIRAVLMLDKHYFFSINLILKIKSKYKI